MGVKGNKKICQKTTIFWLAVCTLLPVGQVAASPATIPDAARAIASQARAEAKTAVAQKETTLRAALAMVQAEETLKKLEKEQAEREFRIVWTRVELKGDLESLHVLEAAEAVAVQEVQLRQRKFDAARSAGSIAPSEQLEAAGLLVEETEKRLLAARKLWDEKAKARVSAKDKVEQRQVELDGLLQMRGNAKNDLAYMSKVRKQSRTILVDTVLAPDLAKRSWTSFFSGSHFSWWRDAHGREGRQYYQPFSVSMVEGPLEYALHTGRVSASSGAGAAGRIDTWIDTTLNITYLQSSELGYQLQLNLPTGKSALPGNAAIVSDDLVEHSRFGAGWNYAPGVFLNRKVNQEDSLRFRSYYSFNGGYTYDSEQPGGFIDPGDVWVYSVGWQHAGPQWQFVSEFSRSTGGMTRERDVQYRQGDQYELQLTYNRSLAKERNLMVYYWQNYQQPTASDNTAIATNQSLFSHYLGMEWSRNINEKRAVRFGIDGMWRQGKIYNPLTNITSEGRSKVSFSLGYDYFLAPNRKVSIDFRRYFIKDNGDDNAYQGDNLFLTYAFSL